MIVLLLLVLMLGVAVGFIAGGFYEYDRTGGSLDLRNRVHELTAQRDQAVQLLARNPGHVHIHTSTEASRDRIAATFREVAGRA